MELGSKGLYFKKKNSKKIAAALPMSWHRISELLGRNYYVNFEQKTL